MTNFLTQILIALFIFTFSGCSNSDSRRTIIIEPDEYYNRFDAELHASIKQYESQLKQYGIPLDASGMNSIKLVPIIVFYNDDGTKMENVIGVCYYSGSIEIESDYFWGQPRVMVEALMYHELGHCVQKLAHRTETIGNDCPSLMNPYIASKNTLVRCWDIMVDELFTDNSFLTLGDFHSQPGGRFAIPTRRL